MFNHLDFDIQIFTNEDGVPFARYYINGKEVDKETYYKLKEDRKDIKFKEKPSNELQELQTDCGCERCLFINSVISDIQAVNHDDAFVFFSDTFNQIEDQAVRSGIRIGIEAMLRDTIDTLNRTLYNLDNLDLFGDEDEE
jgi:hypothetical protein